MSKSFAVLLKSPATFNATRSVKPFTYSASIGVNLCPRAIRLALGLIQVEFGTFNKSTFPKSNDFFARLDPFLTSLPEGFRYAVEIRNPEYLTPA